MSEHLQSEPLSDPVSLPSPQSDLVTIIDGALERFGTRDLVSGSEVLDFLLDLRLAVLATPDALEQLLELEGEAQPAG
jgi:hypothetical protein